MSAKNHSPTAEDEEAPDPRRGVRRQRRWTGPSTSGARRPRPPCRASRRPPPRAVRSPPCAARTSAARRAAGSAAALRDRELGCARRLVGHRFGPQALHGRFTARFSRRCCRHRSPPVSIGLPVATPAAHGPFIGLRVRSMTRSATILACIGRESEPESDDGGGCRIGADCQSDNGIDATRIPAWQIRPRSASSAAPGSTRSSTTSARSRSTRPTARRRTRSSWPPVAGRRVAFLPRHGRRHTIPPHRINYRANVWAMRSLGVKAVISPCAAGSLQLARQARRLRRLRPVRRPDAARGDTFYDGPIVTHLSSAEMYDPELRRLAIETIRDHGIEVHERRHDRRSSRARASRRRPSRSGSPTPAGRSSR